MAPHSIAARALGTTSPNQSLMTVKNIMGWLFAAASVVVVCSFFFWRIRFLRARDRPLRDFFAFMEAPRRRGGFSPPLPRPRLQSRGGGSTPIPLGLQGRGRGRGAGMDSEGEGRRLGGQDSSNASSDVTEGDALPMYEVKGGPPNYTQSLAVDLGTGANGTFQGPGIADQSAQRNPGLDAQLPRPPPPSYTPGTATT